MQPSLTLYAPTASGKTALAIGLAQQFNGVIINADSRQIFKHMPILTAVPTAQEQAQAPHELYELLEPDQPFSAGDYLKLATQTAQKVVAAGKLPIFVGGSGLYMNVLLEGLSDIPDIPPEIVSQLNQQAVEKGTPVLYKELEKIDPTWAAQLPENDTQRIVRGLAVYQHTGKTFTHWQQQPRVGALPYRFLNMAIQRPREEQRNRIAQRLDVMMNDGLIAEIEQLHQQGFSAELPALKSLGIKEFYAYFNKTETLENAKKAMITQHCQYAKRQGTWLKSQYPADIIWEKPDLATAIKTVAQHL